MLDSRILLPWFATLVVVGLGCSSDHTESANSTARDATISQSDQAMMDAATERQADYAAAHSLERAVENSIGMKLLLIPPGEYRRPLTGLRRPADQESDRVVVEMARVFWIAESEVTQSQYEDVMGERPSRFTGVDFPVEQISWDEASEFCQKLSNLEAERAAGREYRLPTEAEWEYACRAGSDAPFCFGSREAALPAFALFGDLSGGTSSVKLRRPNAWGLFDMHGNVSEWCADWYGDYSSEREANPNGPSAGEQKVARGGYWFGAAKSCRSDYRDSYEPGSKLDELGFRVVLEIQDQH